MVLANQVALQLQNTYIGGALGDKPTANQLTSYSAMTGMMVLGTLADIWTNNMINGTNAEIMNAAADNSRVIAQIDANRQRALAEMNATLTRGLAEYQAQSLRVAAESEMFAMQTQAGIQRAIGALNAKMALMQKKDVEDLANQQIARAHQQENKGVGAMRAKLLASGVQESGSAADIKAEQQMVAAVDMTTIKINGARAAFGYENAALQATMNGDLAANESLYKAALAGNTSNMMPAIINAQAQGQADLIQATGNAQANMTLLGGNLQGQSYDSVARRYHEQNQANMWGSILGLGMNIAIMRSNNA